MRTMKSMLMWVLLALSAQTNATAAGDVPIADKAANSVCDRDTVPLATLEPPSADALHARPRDSSDAHPFALGDTLRIRVQKCRLAPIEVGRATQAWLVLDEVVMKGLAAPTVTHNGAADDVILSFRLARDSQAEVNRRAWIELLERQKGEGYLMSMAVGLALGDGLIVPVTGTEFQFRITTLSSMVWTLIVGLAFFFLLFAWLVRSPGALRDAPYGPYSLGKSQMAFWGLLVALAFLGVWFNTGHIEYLPEQVLVLIGISGATGLGAVLIGTGDEAVPLSMTQSERNAERARLKERIVTLDSGREKERPVLQRRLEELDALDTPFRSRMRKFVSDICNDGNGMSIHRVQSVIWTLILGVIFVTTVAQVIAMPEFPQTLLLLLGISNSIYLGFKYPENKAADTK